MVFWIMLVTKVIDRPGVAFSKHLHSQTVRVRKLKFLENVHHHPPVTCQVSGVSCHMSGVRCHILCVRCQFFSLFLAKVVELVGVGSLIYWATPSSLQID